MANFDTQLLNTRLRHYVGPVEFHVTVSLDNTPTQMARFREACRELDGKCVWIELDEGETTNQPMYGNRLFSDPTEQSEKICEVVERLVEKFSVTRVKVEAGPNNNNIPQSEAEAKREPADCYFEHHVALLFEAGTSVAALGKQFAPFSGHLSKNAFKTLSETEEQIRFVTQRFRDIGQTVADERLNELLKFVEHQGYEVIDCEREYNIFDSNLHLDEGWM